MAIVDKKIVSYKELTNLSDNISVNIQNLLSIVNQINQMCTSLVEADLWEGSVANAFYAISSRVTSYSETVLSNFNIVNESKNTVVDMFISTERENANKYF